MYETLEGNASIGLLTFHITCHMDCFIIGKEEQLDNMFSVPFAVCYLHL